jgi:DNA mismatch repair protein MutS
LDRAQEKLSELESLPEIGGGDGRETGLQMAPTSIPAKKEISKEKGHASMACEERQLSLFDFAPISVVEKLREVNLMEITPSQAFKILEELKESIDD